MPPNDADDELLPEIDDDAIVAQQAEAHAPAPRVQVTEEARTIVVAERPSRGRNDPTMVVRAVRHPLPYASAPPPAPLPVQAPVGTRLPAWLPWLIWGVAGFLALLIGAALAVIAERRPAPPPPRSAPAATIRE